MKKIIAIVVVVILLAVGAVMANNKSDNNQTNTAQTNNSSQNNSSQTSATGSVDIKNMAFTPSQITVAKGGTVTWTNNDSTAHTVVDDLSNVGGPASDNISPGETYSFKFEKTGSFQYHCSLHPSMRGTIVVK